MSSIDNMMAQGVVNVAGNLVSQEMQAKHYRENQDYVFKLGQRAQRQTYQNAVESLKQAGLNPAMATGASASSVPTAPSTSPSGSIADAPNPEFEMVGSKKDLMRKQEEQIASGIALNYSGYKKNIADANKADEEARSARLQNEQIEEADEIANWNAGEYLQFLANSARQVGDESRALRFEAMYENWNQGLYNGWKFGLGAIRAIDLLNDSMVKESDKYTKMLDNVLKNTINSATLDQQKVLKAIIEAPLVERQKLYSQMRETSQHVALLQEDVKRAAAETSHTEADTKLIEANVDKVNAEIVELGRKAAAILYSDPHQMWDEGEYFHLGSYLVGRTIETGVDLAKSLGGSYLGGRAFGAGMSAGRTPAPDKQPSTPQSVDRMYREHGAYFEHH